MKNPLLILVLAGIVLSTGCTTAHTVPLESGIDTSVCESPDDCWAYVLKTYVNPEGQVNFDAVNRNRGPLEIYVRSIAAESPNNKPEKFSTADSRLAFYLNSYNALAMWGVLQNGIPVDFDGFFKRVSFFKLNEYVIGGRYISLYDYENDLIRKLGDPRIHFALNCMSVGCPRLPQTPYPSVGLSAVLDAGAREFFNSSTYLVVDDQTKTLRVSEILKFFTGDFVGAGKAANVVAYTNRYASKTTPESYGVEFIPYDWTVNRQ